jgi:hypothetical protein
MARTGAGGVVRRCAHADDGAADLIAGLGLLRNWGGWVIVLAVILGVINLMNIAVGTAIAS